jgi:hypothetical protein
MEGGPGETGLRTGRDRPVEALLLMKPAVVDSRAAAGIRIRIAGSRCLQGVRVLNAARVRRSPKVSVRRKPPAPVRTKPPVNVVPKLLANTVTRTHAQGSIPRTAYALWRVRADIPGVNASRANA